MDFESLGRSTSPEAMEIPDGAKTASSVGRDRKKSVTLNGPIEDSGEKQGNRKMIGRADQVWNKQKHRFEYYQRKPATARNLRFTKYVLLARRKISLKGVPHDEVIDVRGPLLQQALKDIHRNTAGFSFDEDPPVISPALLFHARDSLEALKKTKNPDDPEDKDFIFEIEAALQFVREDFGGTLNSLSNLLPISEITYKTLWAIFPPNMVIYGQDMLRNPRAWTVVRGYETRDNEIGPHFRLETKYLDHDGTELGTVGGAPFKIPEFVGSQSISDLPCYPLIYHPEREKAKANLLEMGRKALRHHGRHLVEYKGHALKEVPPPRGVAIFNAHGRLMLDPEVFDQILPDNDNICVPRVKPVDSNKLTDDQIMTMNTVLYGFSLGDKQWGAFSVSKVEELSWNEDIFQSVVLDKDQRALVHDLVQAHKAQNKDVPFDDIVRDKGKGLVGLLAGPPGVGKTLTAEAVAEVTKRPLYMINSGELGEGPREIRQKLIDVLELAELWDAVLLLDEADVFLAERNDTDLTRNAVASIFLRELEYYQGILILTTNRMKTIDSAFESRIHFCLEYPDLDDASRATVWRNFITRARASGKIDIRLEKENIENLAKMDLNGRQIKNIMSISQTVAAKRRETLNEDSIQKAIKLTQNFSKNKVHLKQ